MCIKIEKTCTIRDGRKWNVATSFDQYDMAQKCRSLLGLLAVGLPSAAIGALELVTHGFFDRARGRSVRHVRRDQFRIDEHCVHRFHVKSAPASFGALALGSIALRDWQIGMVRRKRFWKAMEWSEKLQ